MILFDCERMRYPHTGLYHYCDRLGRAMLRVADSKMRDQICFYLPESCRGIFGENVHEWQQRSWHKLYMHTPKVHLWHSNYQLTRYTPRHLPVLQTVHDLNFLREGVTPSRQTRYYNRIYKHLQNTVHIVAISDFARRDFMTHIDTGNIPVDVIYNGCNIYTGEVEAPVEKPRAPFLLALGTVLPKKNFHVLPCLLEGNDMEFVIIGKLSSYVDEIMAEARRWNVQERVHLVGTVTESVKYWYLQHCTAFLFPSIAEGFGLPVVEAMHYGKPVFLSPHTSLPEIGGDVAYYFPADFERRQMQAVFDAGMNDFGCGVITPETVKAQSARFSWDDAARGYQEIYRSFM